MENLRPIRTILVVDDDKLLLAAYRRVLARVPDTRVFAAATLAGARAVIRKHNPDQCFIDLQIGCDSGIDLIKEVRARAPQVELVLVTAYGSLEIGAEATRAGANHVLAKPFTPEAFLARVTGAPRVSASIVAPSAERVLWEHVRRVMKDCGGNKSEASRQLRMDPSTLRRWLDRPAPKR
jgi:two-component system response regulator RegA